jgi:arylsulfatase
LLATSNARPRTPLATGLACALALLLAACDAQPAEGEPRVARLKLQPVEQDQGPAQAQELATYAIPNPGALSAWILEEPGASAVARTAEGALVLEGGASHTLRLPQAIDPSRVNLIRVELASHGDMTLRTGLVRSANGDRGKDRVVAAEGFEGITPGKRQVVEMDLRRLRAMDEPFDQILLVANGTDLSWSLLSVELAYRPEDRWVPDPLGPGKLMVSGLEARHATGLSNQRPLMATGRVPAAGKLSFSYAWPERMPLPEASARLKLSVFEGDQPLLQESYAFDWARPHWISASLDLSAQAGKQVRTEFALELAPDELAACVLAEVRLGAPHEQAPTVILITSDTHRADHTGVSNSGVPVTTPHIDALAAQGIYFEDALSSSSVTRPSHSALFTSMTPRDTGVIDNLTALGANAETITEHFHAAGYETWALTSARHLDPVGSGLGQGFERMTWPIKELELSADQTLDTLLSWLPDAQGRPLFVWVHLFDAHRPYEPPQEYKDAYYPVGKDPFSEDLPEPDFVPPPGHPRLRDKNWSLAHYKGEISFLDEQLARILRIPRFADAIIGLTADHGENLGEHGLFWNHRGVYPSVLHVPLILRYPGCPPGARVSAGVRQIDLSHTLLAIAEVPAPAFPGNDLRDWIQAEAPIGEPRFAISSGGDNVAIIHDDWMLTLNLTEIPKNKRPYPDGTHPVFKRHALELFNLAQGPRDLVDLAEQEPGRTRALRAALVQWISAPLGDLGDAVPISQSSAADLAALGYGGDEAPAGELWDADCSCEYCLPYR